MDKQKQIEEMAKSCTDCIHYEICALWTTTDLDEDKAYRYCFGHYKPKIPENAVVLTREEYDGLKIIASNYEKAIKEVETKTAEKFAEMANERIAQRQGERDGYEAFTIDDKAKYDGDIVSLALFEICKEITEGKK